MSDQATLSQADIAENRVAKRNLILYFNCQAFGAAAAPVNIALGGLVGSALLGPDKSLSTVPVTTFNVGIVIGAVLANALMRMLGRKLGFMIGTMIGIIGMTLCGFAIMAEHFWFFAASTGVNGVAGGFTQQYRFAAADRGTPDFKPKAISTIMFGGVVAAIVGPQLVLLTSDLVPGVMFAGPFFAATSLFFISFLALTFLKDSELQPAAETNADAKPASSYWDIAKRPEFFIAVLCGTASYALMSFVMTGAPLAMVHHGHSHDHATLGIQWHVMAMFAPSLFTGYLISMFGKKTVVAAGLVILIACAAVAITGLDLMHFWLSLILLGVGWNFGFIGATAMVTSSYEPQDKNKAQGLNDLVVFGFVAFSSLMAGISFNAFGWEFLNLIVFPVTLICLVGLWWLKRVEARASRAS